MNFHAQAVEKLGLLDGRETRAMSGHHGVGGEVSTRIGTIEWFSLAGETFESPMTLFNVGEDYEGDPYALGIVGNGVLGRFRVVFDFTGERVAFLAKP